MNGIRSLLIIAVGACLVVGACRTGSTPASGAASLEPVMAPARSTATPAPSSASAPLAGCPVITADQLDTVIALAIDGLDHPTSGDGWSRISALVHEPNDSEVPHVVTIEIGWQGTLMEFETAPGADPIEGLGDEAYALDAGRRIALRSGELVAVVRYAGETAPVIEALARRVAAQLPD